MIRHKLKTYKIIFSFISLLFVIIGLQDSVHSHEDYEEHLKGINKKLKNSPNNYNLLLKRGRIHLKNKDLEKALFDLNYVFEQAPEKLESLIYRGLVYHKLGDHQLALDDLNNYVSHGKPHFLAFETRASIKRSLGDIEGAIHDYSLAATLRPKPYHFTQRAQLLYQRGLLNEAIASYEEGLYILGDSVPLILELIEFQTEAELYVDALHWVGVIKKRAVRQEEWILKEAEILSLAGHLTEAQEAYIEVLNHVDERIIQGRVTQLIFLQKVRALVGLGRFGEAREIFESLGSSVQQFAVYEQLKKEFNQ